jgi:hypothetical protein
MRRDLHQWFLFGVACSIITTIIVAIASNADLAMSLVVIQGGILLTMFLLIHRRRIWRQVCGSLRDENFRSHELRCKLLVEDNMRRNDKRAHRWSAAAG